MDDFDLGLVGDGARLMVGIGLAPLPGTTDNTRTKGGSFGVRVRAATHPEGYGHHAFSGPRPG